MSKGIYKRPKRPIKICEIENCNERYFAKGYCRKHYAYYIETPRKYGHWHKCEIKNCQNRVTKNYCKYHQYRIKHNLPLDLSIKYSPKGKRNVNWKGGVADYPNHYLMKKNRLIILLNNPKCEKCEKPATEIHHKDFSKTNHNLSNLMAVCHSCNHKLSSKFYKKYKMTVKEMAGELGFSPFKVLYLKKKNRLDSFIDSIK